MVGAGNKKMDKAYLKGVSSLSEEKDIDKYQCGKCCTISVNKVLQDPRPSYVIYKNGFIVSNSTNKVPKKMIHLSGSL